MRLFPSACRTVSLAVLCSFASPGWAQVPVATPGNVTGYEADSAQADAERNGAVVTASGSEESKALASANVISIGWEEISRRRYASLGEILADVPGLYVVEDLVQPSVGVRGVTGGLRAGTRILKVMINGVPVNFRPELTAFLGPEYIPVQMIERVEVAKGPLSALYGANAFVATVNVITRGQAGSALLFEASAHATQRAGGGGYGGTLVGGFTEVDHSMLVSVTADRLDRSGLSVQPGTFAAQDPTLARYRPFFAGPSRGDLSEPVGLYAQSTHRLGSLGSVAVQGGLQHLDAMGEFQLNSVLTHTSRVVLDNDWASLRHEKTWSPNVGSALWLGLSHGAPGRDEQLYLTGTRDLTYTRRFSYTAIDGGGELAFSPFPELQLKAGADFNEEPQNVLAYDATRNSASGNVKPGDPVTLVGPTDRLQATLSNVGGYVQSVLEPLPGLKLTGNARLDVPNLFPAQFSWRAALAKKWGESVTTKLIAGKAFQSPSATLLYGLPGFGSANNVIGNRTLPQATPLVPQTILSLEALTSVAVLGRLVLEAGVFGQSVKDKIEFIQAGSNFQPQNQGVSNSVGGELTAQLSLGRLSLGALGEVVRTVSGGLLQSQPPSLYPSYRFGGSLNVNVPEAHFNLNFRALRVGPRGASQSNIYLNDDQFYSLPAYTRVDVALCSVGLAFLGGAQTVLSLAVRNLLDDRHSEPGFGGIDLPMLGRVGMLELRESF